MERISDLATNHTNVGHLVFKKACRDLVNNHLIEASPEGIYIHPLTQAILRDLLRDKAEHCCGVLLESIQRAGDWVKTKREGFAEAQGEGSLDRMYVMINLLDQTYAVKKSQVAAVPNPRYSRELEELAKQRHAIAERLHELRRASGALNHPALTANDESEATAGREVAKRDHADLGTEFRAFTANLRSAQYQLLGSELSAMGKRFKDLVVAQRQDQPLSEEVHSTYADLRAVMSDFGDAHDRLRAGQPISAQEFAAMQARVREIGREIDNLESAIGHG